MDQDSKQPHDSQPTASSVGAAASDTPCFGRFKSLGLMGEEGDTRTYRAVDTNSGDHVVLKATPVGVIPAGALMRLEHESSILAELESPSCGGVVQASRIGDQFVVASRLVEGQSLRRQLNGGRVDLNTGLALARSLLSALRDLHRHQILHRSVRPSKLIVDPDDPTRATLVDLGSVQDTPAETKQGKRALEVATYASPEQAGSIDHDITPASDLYSAGAVLYHCFAGRPPFDGDALGAILFAHMTSPVPELRSIGVAVPRALEELLQRLLRKDPRDRYQTAGAVLADLEAICERLADGDDDPAVVIGAHDTRHTITEPSFVGRSEQIRTIDHQFQQLRAGRNALVMLEGESGGGKSRLLEEAARRAARDGFWVLRGQGTSEVAQQPFRVLDGIVEGFVAAARAEPDFVEKVREQLGVVMSTAVAAALPALADVLVDEDMAAAAPDETGELLTIEALEEFLNAFAVAGRPVLMIVDDCQWADELTFKLIRRWSDSHTQQVSDSERASVHSGVLMVVAFRAEEVNDDHLLRSVNSNAHLRLPPLTREEIQQLVESMAGPLPTEAVDTIHRIAEGSPFMASAVLRGLTESGALVVGTDGWRVEPMAMDDISSSSRAASFLARRLDMLSDSTVELLATGAVLGKEFELDMAARLAQQTPSDAISAINEARQRRLVWLRPDGGQSVFVHDKIRSAVLERLAPARRQELHRLAAHQIQQDSPDRVSDLAYHFDAAGDRESALPFALDAARRARAQNALEIAEQQYRIALRGSGRDDVRCRVAQGLGETVMMRGRYDEAGDLFDTADRLAQGSFAKAEIRSKMGELAFKRGAMYESAEDYQAALRLLGWYVPQRVWLAGLLLGRDVAIQIGHTLAPSIFLHRVKRQPDEAERLSLQLLSKFAHSCWYSRSKVYALWAHFRGLNIAERLQPSRELAQAYSEHAPAMTLIGAFRRSIRYAEKSLQMRKDLGDTWGQGQSLVFYAIVLYVTSRFNESIEKSRMAIRYLERMGDYWQVHMARYQVAAALYQLGDLPGAIDEAVRNHQSGLELGDEQASGIILDVWIRAARGVLPEGILEAEVGRERSDVQGSTQVQLAAGIHKLESGDVEEAIEVLSEAFNSSARAGITNGYTIPALAWEATARRLHAEQTRDYTPQRRCAILRAAEKTARRAIRARWLCRNDLAQSFREYGLVLAMRGKTRRARRAFQKSLGVAESQQQRYQYAQTLMAMAKVGREAGWPDADNQFHTAEMLLAELQLAGDQATTPHDVPRPQANLSLADRFDTVLDSGRKIASALENDAIFAAAQSAAIRLLRGDRCQVLPVMQEDTSGEGETVGGRVIKQPDNDFNTAVVERALRTGRVVAMADETDDVASETAAEVSERSVLCVPVFVRGRVEACLYVTNDQMSNLFGSEEEQLAGFIATIAGAALENAEGFAELQQLNESLEQRVAERTAAAETRAHELAVSNTELERIANQLRVAQDELLVAKRAAETANEAKSRFLATMSHEIRTPMNGVLGMTELVLNTPLSDQQRNYVRIVRDSANALLTLINDILDLSKIEAGKMELEHVPMDLHDVVVESARLLSVAAANKGLELICDIAPDVQRHVVGDPNRLRQLIVNLVSNAVKFTSSGQVVVQVSVGRETDDGVILDVAVQDSGIGIAADKIESVFEAFRQSDSSTTRRFGGTGLGLTISRQLVELMGGDIWLESEPNVGSTFRLTLPFRLECPKPSVGDSPKDDTRAILFSSHERSRKVCADLLRGCGLQVTVETDVDAALEQIRRVATAGDQPAIIVADMLAASDDALQLAEEVNRDASIADLPILMLLPAGQVDAAERCRQLGTARSLIKPAKPVEIAEAVAALLGDEADQVPVAEMADAEADDPLHILVVDDGPVNQEVAAGLLGLHGHTVEIASDGLEAIDAFERGTFDVIFMDIEMPNLDGITAAGRIREMEADRDTRTPIYAMSAHALKGFTDRCLEAGMDGYVTKPINPDELFAVTQRISAALASQPA